MSRQEDIEKIVCEIGDIVETIESRDQFKVDAREKLEELMRQANALILKSKLVADGIEIYPVFVEAYYTKFNDKNEIIFDDVGGASGARCDGSNEQRGYKGNQFTIYPSGAGNGRFEDRIDLVLSNREDFAYSVLIKFCIIIDPNSSEESKRKNAYMQSEACAKLFQKVKAVKIMPNPNLDMESRNFIIDGPRVGIKADQGIPNRRLASYFDINDFLYVRAGNHNANPKSVYTRLRDKRKTYLARILRLVGLA